MTEEEAEAKLAELNATLLGKLVKIDGTRIGFAYIGTVTGFRYQTYANVNDYQLVITIKTLDRDKVSKWFHMTRITVWGQEYAKA